MLASSMSGEVLSSSHMVLVLYPPRKMNVVSPHGGRDKREKREHTLLSSPFMRALAI